MNNRNKSEPVAVLGLGSMGSALADALLSAGCQLLVWNRTASKAEPLIQNCARVANSAVSAIQAAAERIRHVGQERNPHKLQ